MTPLCTLNNLSPSWHLCQRELSVQISVSRILPPHSNFPASHKLAAPPWLHPGGAQIQSPKPSFLFWPLFQMSPLALHFFLVGKMSAVTARRNQYLFSLVHHIIDATANDQRASLSYCKAGTVCEFMSFWKLHEVWVLFSYPYSHPRYLESLNLCWCKESLTIFV